MNFQKLKEEVQAGIEGRNTGIPMGFDRLNKYIGIRKSMYYLIGGNTGCLSGDTEILINRRKSAKSARLYTLKELYYKFNRKLIPNSEKRNGHFWDKSIDTNTLSFLNDRNRVGINKIIDVYESGIKTVYKVVTDSGKEIKTTLDHRFLTDLENNFKRLSELNVGDTIICRHRELKATGRKKRIYRPEIITEMPYYPSARPKTVKTDGIVYNYHRIKRSRLVFDANLNKMTMSEFLYEVKNNCHHNLKFSDIKMDVHHKDENPLNDVPDNLELVTKKEHSKLHCEDFTHHLKNTAIHSEKIISITKLGEEMTYDIEMQSPYNNFVANDIIVHNSGKTSLVDDAFVLNPLDWYLSAKGKASGIKLKIIYRSMERSMTYKLAKWVSRKIFLDRGIIIPVNKLLGWNSRMTMDEHDIFLLYEDYIGNMKEVVTIIDGPENPVGIAKELAKYAMSCGKVEQIDEYNKVYIPDEENKIVIPIFDHVGLLKLTKAFPTKKESIDKLSDELRYARDLYGMSPVAVSQFNRSISNPIRIKNGDVEPQLEDFSDTSQTQNDADVVLALFDPIRYKVEDPSGYNLEKLRDDKGAKYFRSVRLIKNSYGEDDIRIGLGFLGEVGMFKELPRLREMTDDDYDRIINKSYFLD